MDRVGAPRRRRDLALSAAGTVVVVALVVWAARRIDVGQVWRVLRTADPLLLGTAIPALLALNVLLRAARFRALVAALPPTRAGPYRFWEAARSLVVSLAANNVLPLRLGELVRTRDLLAHGHPLAAVAVAQLTEKGVELSSMVLCALPLVPLGLLQIPRAHGLFWAAAAATAVVAVGAGLWLWRARARLWPGGRAQVRAALRAFWWSLSADLAELALIAATLGSLGIAAGWKEPIAVLIGVNLAIALPSTPGQLGAFEAGSAVALTLVGIPAERAVAFAVLYRIVQWMPVTLLGAVLWLGGRRRGALAVAAPPFGGS